MPLPGKSGPRWNDNAPPGVQTERRGDTNQGVRDNVAFRSANSSSSPSGDRSSLAESAIAGGLLGLSEAVSAEVGGTPRAGTGEAALRAVLANDVVLTLVLLRNAGSASGTAADDRSVPAENGAVVASRSAGTGAAVPATPGTRKGGST